MTKELVKKELIRHAMSEFFHGGMEDDAFLEAQQFLDYEKGESIFGQRDKDVKTFFLLVAEAL